MLPTNVLLFGYQTEGVLLSEWPPFGGLVPRLISSSVNGSSTMVQQIL
jgi:hypothetical protein